MVNLPDGQGGTIEVCKAAEWAGQFYKLRNDIIHGGAVTADRLQYKDWITHLIVADLVMLELVKRLLYKHGCIGDDIRRRVADLAKDSPEPPEKIEEALLPSILGLDVTDVHEALGWISQQ